MVFFLGTDTSICHSSDFCLGTLLSGFLKDKGVLFLVDLAAILFPLGNETILGLVLELEKETGFLNDVDLDPLSLLLVTSG
jgi:hypothetical protein